MSRALGFTIREGLLNLRRAPLLALSSVSVMTLSLFVLGIFLLLTVNLRAVILAAQREVEIVVFVEEGAPQEELLAVDAALRAHPAVSGLVFLAREEALVRFRGELGEREYLLDALESNPLPDTFEVALFDDWKSTARLRSVAEDIGGLAGVAEVKYGREWVGRLNRIIVALVLVDLFLGIVVALSSLVVVANTIRLTLIARREMIEIMKLVGATAGVIRRPFVVEGVVQGAVAAALAMALLLGLAAFLDGRAGGVVFPPTEAIVGFLLFGAFLGGLGGVISLQGLLRRW
ncbi:MAG: permease-like cell division protein FtsX [Gemmatimonadota bacterium]|jgi:cell division transport system permease protein|nr:permease-like cell division protein FtsX [Gemmatimonadota bacterium]MDP6803434.1 permease-like cell division protein FtsX [Gemmatimonadota bacterium]MDP7030929.1 permease-like cell division protein FtsX [Gemmatimonadota bacterium]